MIIVDLIGYVAIIFVILSSLTSNVKLMRFYGAISTTLFGISIYFYNGINGLFVTIISLITKILSIFIKESKLKFLKYISFVLSILFFIYFNKEGWIGILPSISIIFIIFADLQTNIIKMKQVYYGSAICWLLYGIFLGSLPAIIFDIVNIALLYIGIKRLKKKELLFYR